MKENKNRQQQLPDCSSYFQSLNCATILLVVLIISISLIGLTSQKIAQQPQQGSQEKQKSIKIDAYDRLAFNPTQLSGPNYQIWIIFTGMFIEKSFIALIFMLLSYSNFLTKLEKRTSSVWLFINYIFTGLVIFMIFFGVWQLFGDSSLKNYIGYGGASAIWFNLVTKYCYFNQQKQLKMCCSEKKVSKNVYPVIMLIVICLLEFKIKLDIVIGVIIAFIQCKFFKGAIISYKCCCFEILDSKCCCCIDNQRCIRHNFNKNDRLTFPFAGIQNQDDFSINNSSQFMDKNTFQGQKGYSINDQ